LLRFRPRLLAVGPIAHRLELSFHRRDRVGEFGQLASDAGYVLFGCHARPSLCRARDPASAERRSSRARIRHLSEVFAAEIQRIAEWRGTSASEIARALMRHGVAVERQLEAQELQRPYEYSKIERDPDRGYMKIEARWVWYTPRELAEMQADENEWRSMEA
jgi:hypothetical protein